MRPWEITSQFCRGIAAATRAPAEFPAFLFQPFDSRTIEEMIASLPPLEAYKAMAHPDAMVDERPTRFALGLNQNAVACPFWIDLAEALKGDLVRQAIATALDLDPVLLANPAVALLRDLPGYKIRIHPDTKRKIATVQIYLASHTRSPQIGARFYRQDGPEDFTQTAAVPYLPGSGYFFRRQDNSWHAVEPTTEQDGERNSLMLVYFDSPKIGFN